MIIINETLGTYGGSITLIERICNWCHKINEKICIFTSDVSNKEIVEKLNKMAVNIYCFDTSNNKELKRHVISIKERENKLIIINFTFNGFLNFELFRRRDLDFVNIIYCIHPETFYKCKGIKSKIIKKIVINKYKRLVLRMNKNGNIIFMDNDTIEKTESFYKMKFDTKPKVSFLPIEFEDITNSSNEKISTSYNSKMLITSCRAEFPFKGYLFGLIDDFATLLDNYPEIKLTIVTSGEKEDVLRVKDKINDIPINKMKSITLYSWMEYRKLKEMISNSYLYIGMGTGILDSVSQMVPAIPVKYNTYGCISNHIFNEKPEILLENEKKDYKAMDVVKNLIEMSMEEYKEISIDCYRKARNLYGVDAFLDNILSLKQSKKVLSFDESLLYSINLFVNRKKKINEYSCKQIEYEEEQSNFDCK